jgi:hypothetical protein
MLLAKVINNVVEEYPLTIYQVRTQWPDISWPEEPNLQALSDVNLVVVTETSPPSSIRHQVVLEGTPVYDTNLSCWKQTWETTSEALLSAKQKEKEYLAEVRYNHEIQDVAVSYRESTIYVKADRESQLKLISVYTMAKDGYWVDGNTWKCADSTFREMTSLEMITVALTVSAFVQYCFSREQELCDQIDAATTIEAVQNWTW